MITFETLFELLRKEKFNQELQNLDEDFYEQVKEYLEEKKAIVDKEQNADSIFSSDARKTQLQLENAKKIIKELYEKRESKILNLALLSSRVNMNESRGAMLKEEKELYKETRELLDIYRSGVMENALLGRKIKVESKNATPKELKTQQSDAKESRLVRFTNAVPKFVANDLNIYGPFEQEDLSYLPRKTADLLIRRNRAEEVNVEDSKN